MTYRTSNFLGLTFRVGFLSAAMVFLLAHSAAGQDDSTPADLQQQLSTQSQQIQELQQQLARQQELMQQLSDVPESLSEPNEPGTEDQDYANSRLESLEERISGLQTQQEQFLDNPSESLRVVTGRLHLDAWSFSDSSPGINIIETGNPAGTPQNRLVFRRIRLGVGGQVAPKNMSYRVELEFSGDDGSQFRDAWIGWDDLVVLQTIRVGNQKRPYGFDQLHSSNYMIFLERPFIDDAVNADNRRFGTVMYGVSDNQAFNWRMGVFDLRLVQDLGKIVDDNIQPELAWRLANTCWYDECSDGRNYAHLGLSGTFAFPDGLAPNVRYETNEARFRTRPEARSSNMWLDTGRIAGAGSYQLLGIESVLNVGEIQLGGEFMNVWLQRLDRYDPDVYFSGGYLYASYFLTGEHIPWNRGMGVMRRIKPREEFSFGDQCEPGGKRGIGALQVAVRLSYADFNDEDVFGGRGQSVTAALNWYWNSHTRLQLNYLVGRVDDRKKQLDTGDTVIVSGDYQTLGVRAMIDF